MTIQDRIHIRKCYNSLLMNSIDGVLEAINILYFNGIPGFKHVEYAIETLKQHRLINFTIDIDGDMPF